MHSEQTIIADSWSGPVIAESWTKAKKPKEKRRNVRIIRPDGFKRVRLPKQSQLETVAHLAGLAIETGLPGRDYEEVRHAMRAVEAFHTWTDSRKDRP